MLSWLGSQTCFTEHQVFYVHPTGSIIRRLLSPKIWKDKSLCCPYDQQYQWFIVSEGGHLHGRKLNTLSLSTCNFKLYEHNLRIMILLPSKVDNFEALFAPGVFLRYRATRSCTREFTE